MTRLAQYPGPLPYILGGILKHGAQIGYSGPLQHILSKNLSSASLAPHIIDRQVTADLQHGRISLHTGSAPFISSPLGLVPKGNGGWRRIHHLSFPTQLSVNDHIPAAFGAITYVKFDDILNTIRRTGRGSIIVKRDIESAFRNVPVALSNRWLLGLKWGLHYTENCLPFGLRTAPFLFNLFAEGFHWILQHRFGWLTRHYLDDFIFIFAPTSQPQRLLRSVMDDYSSIASELGIPQNTTKDEQGTTVTALGLEIDTAKMEARLPAKKL